MVSKGTGPGHMKSCIGEVLGEQTVLRGMEKPKKLINKKNDAK